MKYDKEFMKKDGRVLRAGGPRDIQRRHNVVDQSGVVEELRKTIATLNKQLEQKTATGGFSADDVDEEIRKAVKNTAKEVAGSYQDSIKKLKKNNNILEKEVVGLKEKGKSLTDELEQTKEEHKKELKTAVKEEADKYRRLIEQVDDGYKRTIKQLEKTVKVLEERHEGEKEFLDLLQSGSLSATDGEVSAKLDILMDKIGMGDEVGDPKRPKIEDVFIDPLEEDSGEGLESHIIVDDVISDDEKEDVRLKVDKLKEIMGKLPNK